MVETKDVEAEKWIEIEIAERKIVAAIKAQVEIDPENVVGIDHVSEAVTDHHTKNATKIVHVKSEKSLVNAAEFPFKLGRQIET